jgi:hypothetical protein
MFEGDELSLYCRRRKQRSAIQTKKVAGRFFFWKDAIMRRISSAIDKLPRWAKLIFYGFTILVSVYYIAQYGLFHFLLRVIFSP